MRFCKHEQKLELLPNRTSQKDEVKTKISRENIREVGTSQNASYLLGRSVSKYGMPVYWVPLFFLCKVAEFWRALCFLIGKSRRGLLLCCHYQCFLICCKVGVLITLSLLESHFLLSHRNVLTPH
jgi:hypothetical protein